MTRMQIDTQTNKHTDKQHKNTTTFNKVGGDINKELYRMRYFINVDEHKDIVNNKHTTEMAVQLCDFVFPLINEQLVKLAKWMNELINQWKLWIYQWQM